MSSTSPRRPCESTASGRFTFSLVGWVPPAAILHYEQSAMSDESEQSSKMDRRAFLGGLGALGLASALGTESMGKQRKRSSERPNVLFVWSDDQAASDLGCYGNSVVRTPNLDRLASEGVRFRRAYVASPQCSPSRSAAFTGQSPHTTNTSRLHSPLRDRYRSVLEPLKEEGYFVGTYRKVHLGASFMKRWDFDGSVEGAFNHADAEGVTFRDFFEERPTDAPFFLHVGLTEPHRPYEEGTIDEPHEPSAVEVPPFLPDTAAVRRDLALYYDEITVMDATCGRLFALLEEYGVADDTLVVFAADNGMPFPGGKGTLYEPGVRVPLIVRWPGVTEEGRVTDALVSLVDLPSTLLDAAEAQPLAEAQGKSFRPVLEGRSDEHRDHVFVERNWHDNLDLIRGVITDRYKLIKNFSPRWPYRPTLDLKDARSWASLRRERENGALNEALARRYFQAERPHTELYDLETDPDELTNRADELNVKAELQHVLSDWMKETNDFLPPPDGAFGGLDLDVDPLSGS